MKEIFKFLSSLELYLSEEKVLQKEKKEYVDLVVRILRRDFNTEEQNEILFSIGQKLSALREEDLRKMEKEYGILQKNTETLRSIMQIT